MVCSMSVRSIPSGRKLSVLGAACLLLSACEQEADGAGSLVAEHTDPLMSAALADQIMVDPDMVGRNGANQAASFVATDGALPQPDGGPEAARAARDEALALIGGSAALRRAPQPERIEGELPPEAALSVAARAAAATGGGARDCAALAQFSAAWAARLPDGFPVYPRGAVHEAAGTDQGRCHLRVVNFTTPVSLPDVLDFYYTRAMAEGFVVQAIMQGEDHVLGGVRQGRSFMVFARAAAAGQTSVDLVTTGG